MHACACHGLFEVRLLDHSSLGDAQDEAALPCMLSLRELRLNHYTSYELALKLVEIEPPDECVEMCAQEGVFEDVSLKTVRCTALRDNTIAFSSQLALRRANRNTYNKRKHINFKHKRFLT